MRQAGHQVVAQSRAKSHAMRGRAHRHVRQGRCCWRIYVTTRLRRCGTCLLRGGHDSALRSHMQGLASWQVLLVNLCRQYHLNQVEQRPPRTGWGALREGCA